MFGACAVENTDEGERAIMHTNVHYNRQLDRFKTRKIYFEIMMKRGVGGERERDR